MSRRDRSVQSLILRGRRSGAHRIALESVDFCREYKLKGNGGSLSTKTGLYACALALGIALVPTAASADDPRDPSMRSAEARGRDKAIIKRLNQERLAYVERRDAQYAGGWRAYREGPRINASRQAQHERDMGAWRRAIAMCRAGYREFCSR